MITGIETALADWQEVSLETDRMACWWLGQAGFLLRHRDACVLIDPYLSDSLAVKYREARFKHKRMVPVPIEPGALSGLDWIFCTHQHTDHMDGGTLPGLMRANPRCRILAPAASVHHLVDVIGVSRARVHAVDAGDSFEWQAGCEVHAIASAHETLACDHEGHSLCLGYVCDLRGVRLYHAGDCVPYPGLAETLKSQHIDVALLPVNGRDAYRKQRGVPGNFHFEEAVSLCCEAGIRVLVPHHFAMFDFNTADPAVWQTSIDALDGRLQVVVPQIGRGFLITGNSLT